MSSWYTTHAPEDDIAVSTRIRLARNLSGLPFPARMTPEQRRELNLKVKNAVLQSNTPFAKSLKYIDMADVPQTEIAAMVERHIISPEFAEENADRAIIISADESISIMIGEEDASILVCEDKFLVITSVIASRILLISSGFVMWAFIPTSKLR